MKERLYYHLPYIPIVGMAVYIIVFTLAAMEYPGGSDNLASTVGYSFFHNFLCDTLNEVTQSGAANAARPIAIISHIILSITMICFFYILPEVFSWKNTKTQTVRIAGVFTMVIFIFMFTTFHDTIVVLTALFGTVALIPFFLEIRKLDNTPLKQLAYTCYGMSAVVFAIYQTKIGIYYLPLLQKFTFFLDASWVIWVSLIVLKKNSRQLAEA